MLSIHHTSSLLIVNKTTRLNNLFYCLPFTHLSWDILQKPPPSFEAWGFHKHRKPLKSELFWIFLLSHALTSPPQLLALQKWQTPLSRQVAPRTVTASHFHLGTISSSMKYVCPEATSLCIISSHVCYDRTLVVIWSVVVLQFRVVCANAILGQTD